MSTSPTVSDEDIEILEDDAGDENYSTLAERLKQDEGILVDESSLVEVALPQPLARVNKKSKSKPSDETSEALRLTSRKAKWTVEEISLFTTGLEIYGKSWPDIAELVHTKTAEQAKEYSHLYFKKKTREARAKVRAANEYQKKQKLECDINWLKSEVQVIEATQQDSDVDVDIDSMSDSDPSPLRTLDLKLEPSSPTKPLVDQQTPSSDLKIIADEATNIFPGSQLDPIYESLDEIDIMEPDLPEPPPVSQASSNNDEQLSSADGEETQAIPSEVMPIYAEDYGVLNSDCRFVPLPAPSCESSLSDSVICDIEKKVHVEFFEGRVNKTPERYTKIRNYILEQWLKQKPKYLNKTRVRSGLRQCGDVNCIGRIHALLEQLGAINFGCEETNYKIIYTSNRVPKAKPTRTEAVPAISLPQRQRKRPIASTFGGVTPSFGGSTTEHNDDEPMEQPSIKLSRPHLRQSSLMDPYQLVPCLDFYQCHQGIPFRVVIESQAAVIMDVHSHICKTEVIGMLGGLYNSDSGCLTVYQAEPCMSVSSQLHCDMDPVSQTRAGQLIEEAGFKVVGWYHSHPTFIPDPSRQDIDSQLKFQQWFSKEGSHFLGIIVNPYNMIKPECAASEIRCFTLAPKQRVDGKPGQVAPFRFDYQIATTGPPEQLQTVLVKVSRLLQLYENYDHTVDMLDTYHSGTELTALEKLMKSLEGYLKTADPSNISYSMLLDDLKFVIESFYEKAS